MMNFLAFIKLRFNGERPTKKVPDGSETMHITEIHWPSRRTGPLTENEGSRRATSR